MSSTVSVVPRIDEEAVKFQRMADEGREIFMAVMGYMACNWTFRALELIGRGNNWQRIACSLAVVFHTEMGTVLRRQKARGYDRLRDLVITCATDLRNTAHPFPGNYYTLVNRLFTSQGFAEP